MFDGFSVLCYDKLDFNFDKGDMDGQNLAQQKDNFLSFEREDREKFFFAPSGYPNFQTANCFFICFQPKGNISFIMTVNFLVCVRIWKSSWGKSFIQSLWKI